MIPIVEIRGTNLVSDDRIRANIRAARERGLPELVRLESPREGLFSIVAAGPSMRDFLPTISGRDMICGAGSGYRALLQAGIEPHIAVALDPLPCQAATFEQTSKSTRYYIASQCDPAVFDALAGCDVVVWHAGVGVDIADLLGPAYKIIGGGSTVTLRALSIGMMLGYRDFEFFGFDACLIDGARHMLPEWNNLTAQDNGETLEVTAHGKTFVTTTGLASMAMSYIETAKAWGHAFRVAVHGDGLISWITHQGKKAA